MVQWFHVGSIPDREALVKQSTVTAGTLVFSKTSMLLQLVNVTANKVIAFEFSSFREINVNG